MSKTSRAPARKRTSAKQNPVCILGLGYVGLTLAVAFADKGFSVYGVDVNKALLKRLQAGKAPFLEPGLEEKMRNSRGKSIIYTETIPTLDEPVTYIIAVGTNLLPSGRPDFSHLKSASQAISKELKKDDLVLIRSTTTIGATRTIVQPILERASGLSVGKDFFLAFAPERTVEGRALEEIAFLPQIIGGATLECRNRACAFFERITRTLVPVSSLEEAELVKLMTNTYRDISFAVANNLARIASEHAIDINDAITAANYLYPRNNIPLPSPGVGGYCLTKDPLLLTAHSKRAFGYGDLHREGRKINTNMPVHVARLVASFVKDAKLKQPRVVVAGLAFKGNPPTSDARFSPSKDLIDALRALGITRISGFDTHVGDDIYKAWHVPKTTSLKEAIAAADVVVFMHRNDAHTMSAFPVRTKRSGLILDPWRMYDRATLNKKGWAYGSLSLITKP